MARAINRSTKESRWPSLFDDRWEKLIDRMFERYFEDFPVYSEQLTPPADVVEHQNKWEILLDMPGVDNDKINLEWKDGVLEIRAERPEIKCEEGSTLRRNERRCGEFIRHFRLEGVKEDEISATLHNGVLKIEIPKREEKVAKKIPVKVG